MVGNVTGPVNAFLRGCTGMGGLPVHQCFFLAMGLTIQPGEFHSQLWNALESGISRRREFSQELDSPEGLTR